MDSRHLASPWPSCRFLSSSSTLTTPKRPPMPAQHSLSVLSLLPSLNHSSISYSSLGWSILTSALIQNEPPTHYARSLLSPPPLATADLRHNPQHILSRPFTQHPTSTFHQYKNLPIGEWNYPVFSLVQCLPIKWPPPQLRANPPLPPIMPPYHHMETQTQRALHLSYGNRPNTVRDSLCEYKSSLTTPPSRSLQRSGTSMGCMAAMAVPKAWVSRMNKGIHSLHIMRTFGTIWLFTLESLRPSLHCQVHMTQQRIARDRRSIKPTMLEMAIICLPHNQHRLSAMANPFRALHREHPVSAAYLLVVVGVVHLLVPILHHPRRVVHGPVSRVEVLVHTAALQTIIVMPWMDIAAEMGPLGLFLARPEVNTLAIRRLAWTTL